MIKKLLTTLIIVFSSLIPSLVYGAIAFDNATSSWVAASSITFPFTTSGSNRYLLLGINVMNSGDLVSTVTYGGTNMSRLAYIAGSGNPSGTYLYYLSNPSLGTNNVSINAPGASYVYGTAFSYTGVAQTAPEASSTASNSNSTTLSTTLSTVSNNAWVVSVFTNSLNGGTAGTNTTQRLACVGQCPAIYESSLNPITPTSSVTLNITGAGQNPAWDNRFIAVSLAPFVAPTPTLSPMQIIWLDN